MMGGNKMSITKERKELLVKQLLVMINENPDREGLVGTPDRVVRMWDEIFKGYKKENEPKVTVFNNGHDGIIYDEMITDSGDFYSHCEHHMVPFYGKYFFSYIPHPKGKLLGLSKVARVVDYFSAKLQVQERLTHEIINYLWSTLCDKTVCKYPPIAMGLRMEAEHLCKTMRGVKKKGKMTTTQLFGEFKTHDITRQEFLNWVNKNV